VSGRDVATFAAFPGFWKVIRQNLRSGAREMRNSLELNFTRIPEHVEVPIRCVEGEVGADLNGSGVELEGQVGRCAAQGDTDLP